MSTFVTVYKANFYDVRSYMQNIRTLHGAVNRAMGCEDSGRTAASALFFVEDDLQYEQTWLYIQGSREAGEVARFTKHAVHCLDKKLENIRDNDLVEFCLRCSPMRHARIKGDPKGTKKYINSEIERWAWLNRQGERMGFSVEAYHEYGKTTLYFNHGELDPGKRAGKKDACDTYGIMRVRDADTFRKTIVEGIGSGKAYGCGMLFTA